MAAQIKGATYPPEKKSWGRGGFKKAIGKKMKRNLGCGRGKEEGRLKKGDCCGGDRCQPNGGKFPPKLMGGFRGRLQLQRQRRSRKKLKTQKL